MSNKLQLEQFSQHQNKDRPHGLPDPHHGHGTLGRSTYIEPSDFKIISIEESWRLGVKGRSVWKKAGRKVKDDAMAPYMVKSTQIVRDGKITPTPTYFAFSIDQTEPVRKKKRSNKMPISLPKNLPMKELKKRFGTAFDRVRVLLYFITMKKIFDRRFRDAEDFINLYSPILQKFMGNKYRTMIDILNGWIIEVDEHYDFITEHRSKGYRFKDEILAEGFCHDFITDEQVIRQFDKPRPTERVDRHLWHYLTKLEVNESAVPINELELGQEHLIENMIRGVWKYDVDDYGRRHTNLTNLCRIGRNCLRYENLPLVGLDIRNSQPLIFGIMVMRILRNNLKSNYIEERKEKGGKGGGEGMGEGTLPYVVRSMTQEVEILLENSTFSRSCILPQPVINFSTQQLPFDVQNYLELCQDGKIYEELMNEAGLSNRDCAKEIIFAVIYGPNRRRYDNVKEWRSIEDYEWLVTHSNNDTDRFENSLPLRKLIVEAMERRFPTIVACMAEIKGGKEKHYKNLAQQMQRAESELIFGSCRDLMNRHPEVPIWTIHDCLLTVPGRGYEEIIEDALLAHFAKHGVRPSIKKEYYGS